MTTSDLRAELLHVALDAAARGWRVFPLWPGSKKPALHGRAGCPRTGPCEPEHQGWEQRATTDPEVIRRCWGLRPFNIGIATGPSELVVVDLDRPKPGEEAPPPWNQPGIESGEDVFIVLAADAGEIPPLDTYTLVTPSGGTHLYYTAPDGQALRNTASDRGQGLGWRIDTRAHGGYVVGAGSVVDGHHYQITEDAPVRPLPPWLGDRLARPSLPTAHAPELGEILGGVAQRSRYAAAAIRGELEQVLAAQPGCRNDTLNTSAYVLGQLIAADLLPERLVFDALLAAGTAIGLSSRECHATIQSGLAAGMRQPRQMPA